MTTTRQWFIPLLLISLVLAGMTDAMAQSGPPSGAVTNATYKVSSLYKAMKGLGYTVALICALIGSVKVYNKFVFAEPDLYQTIIAWSLAILFCMFFPYFVDLLFR